MAQYGATDKGTSRCGAVHCTPRRGAIRVDFTASELKKCFSAKVNSLNLSETLKNQLKMMYSNITSVSHSYSEKIIPEASRAIKIASFPLLVYL